MIKSRKRIIRHHLYDVFLFVFGLIIICMFNIIFYVFFIVYEELIFRIMLSISITSNILSLFFISINMGIALGIISNFIPKKINRYLFNFFNFILCFYYGGALIIRKVFNIDISFSVLNMYKQFTTGEFTGTVFSVLESNIVSIILVIIPFIIGIITYSIFF